LPGWWRSWPIGRSACLGDAAAFRETWTKQQGYFTGKLKQSECFEGRQPQNAPVNSPLSVQNLEQRKSGLSKYFDNLRALLLPITLISKG
jgi:hypothetical protein